MKSIILENGTIINVDANIMLWDEKDKDVTLKSGNTIIAFLNINKIVGIVDTESIKGE